MLPGACTLPRQAVLLLDKYNIQTDRPPGAAGHMQQIVPDAPRVKQVHLASSTGC